MNANLLMMFQEPETTGLMATMNTEISIRLCWLTKLVGLWSSVIPFRAFF